ncbi:hypothetical protein JKP88DRAFT_267890 [Tribonema minus]|uniref:Uncharacterized protein n=1 Tax=Tribonema minus TaxID=303371 RepID=A0A835Z6W1_9STRA|nr:hypothetical protein JKP88DRAFT_267890 [Tribonema minus]
MHPLRCACRRRCRYPSDTAPASSLYFKCFIKCLPSSKGTGTADSRQSGTPLRCSAIPASLLLTHGSPALLVCRGRRRARAKALKHKSPAYPPPPPPPPAATYLCPIHLQSIRKPALLAGRCSARSQTLKSPFTATPHRWSQNHRPPLPLLSLPPQPALLVAAPWRLYPAPPSPFPDPPFPCPGHHARVRQRRARHRRRRAQPRMGRQHGRGDWRGMMCAADSRCEVLRA